MELLFKIPLLVWLVVSALFFAAGEYYSKRWALVPGWGLAGTVVLMYVLGVITWLPALLQKNQLAVLGTIWLLLGCLVTVAIGTLIFDETLNSVQWTGVGVALVALALLAH